MVARGTYSELRRSGLNLTSLLKEDEGQEEERQGTTPIPGTISHFSHTVSDNSMSSMSSLSSSRYSLIEGTEPLTMVGVFETDSNLEYKWHKAFFNKPKVDMHIIF